MTIATIGPTRLPDGERAFRPEAMNATQTTRDLRTRPSPATVKMAACADDMAIPVRGSLTVCRAAPTVISRAPAPCAELAHALPVRTLCRDVDQGVDYVSVFGGQDEVEPPAHELLDRYERRLLDADDQHFRIGGQHGFPQVPMPFSFGLPFAEFVEDENICTGLQSRCPSGEFLHCSSLDGVSDRLSRGERKTAVLGEHLQRVVGCPATQLVPLTSDGDEALDEAELRRGAGEACQRRRLARSDRSGDGYEKHGFSMIRSRRARPWSATGRQGNAA